MWVANANSRIRQTGRAKTDEPPEIHDFGIRSGEHMEQAGYQISGVRL